MTLRCFKCVHAVLVVGLLCSSSADAGGIPAYGVAVPELSAFDDEVIQIMQDHDLPGCVLAVAKDGCVVYQRGFGCHDNGTYCLSSSIMVENTPMRVASVSKSLTAQAIAQLAEDGLLSMGDAVFDIGQPGGGILNLDPFPALQDVRIGDITVQHLVDHKAGWADDYAFWEITIANAMDIESPPGRENMVRYALGLNLANTPGAVYSYSNFGYLVLSLVIEAAGGTGHAAYLRQKVLTVDMWVPATELYAGAVIPTNNREPYYVAEDFWIAVPNVFDPQGDLVPWPYGGFDTPAVVGPTSMVSSAAPMLMFLHQYYPDGGYGFLGSMPGTNSAIKALSGDVGIVVLTNERLPDDEPYAVAGELAERIAEVINNGVTWPTTCVDGFWVQQNVTPGFGSYDRPFTDVAAALNSTAAGSKVLYQPGYYVWTGIINQRVRFDAPFGSAQIGN